MNRRTVVLTLALVLPLVLGAVGAYVSWPRQARIVLAAAQAAKAFQPTRSLEAANAARPWLVTYFHLLASATPGGFDVEEAARLEFDWWQARREAVGPEQYGVTVARGVAITDGKPADDPSLLIPGIGRAEAMAYRDARGQAMTDPDWSEIECRLPRVYRSLKAAVAGGQDGSNRSQIRTTKKPRTMPGLLGR
jgi:hypothetical protein